jgi:hypothetical protein
MVFSWSSQARLLSINFLRKIFGPTTPVSNTLTLKFLKLMSRVAPVDLAGILSSRTDESPALVFFPA